MIIKIFKIKLSLRRNKLDSGGNKGLTLIELLIGISVFVIVLSAITGIFISGVRVQKRFLAQQELLNEATKIAEYLSKSIRAAIEDTSPACIISANTNYQVTDQIIDQTNRDSLSFLKRTSGTYPVCQTIFVEVEPESNIPRIKINATIVSSPPNTFSDYLTSADFKVKSLNFQSPVYGDQGSDNIQPRITFSLEIEDKTGEKVKISSTVSQRNLDVNL